MTVEYLSAKLIEKAMSEQNAYVPPNRNLIVAAETLKKQQAEIARLHKELAEAKEGWHVEMPNVQALLDAAHNDAIEAAAKRVSLYFMEERLPLMQRSIGAHLGIADCVRTLKK